MSGKNGIKVGDLIESIVMSRTFRATVKDIVREKEFGNHYSVVIDLPDFVSEQIRYDQHWPCDWCESLGRSECGD